MTLILVFKAKGKTSSVTELKKPSPKPLSSSNLSNLPHSPPRQMIESMAGSLSPTMFPMRLRKKKSGRPLEMRQNKLFTPVVQSTRFSVGFPTYKI